jgi:hypothetical protein
MINNPEKIINTGASIAIGGTILYTVRVENQENAEEHIVFVSETQDGKLTKPVIIESNLNKLSSISKLQIKLNKEQFTELGEFLKDMYSSIPRLYCYSNMGYIRDLYEKLYFNGSEIINCSTDLKDNSTNSAKELSTAYSIPDFIDSIDNFSGNRFIEDAYPLTDSTSCLKRIGSLDDSLTFINGVSRDSMPMQTLISTGLAAPLVYLLRHKPVLLNLKGRSSTGKTKSCLLVTSLFSTPADSRLLIDFDRTLKSIEAHLEGKNGIPVVIDDSSTNQNTENTNSTFIYTLSKGIGRSRLNKGNNPTEPEMWHNTIIMSSEVSMFEKCDPDKLGVLRRLIELPISQGDLTKDSAMCREIEKFTKLNYGLVGTEFVKQLANKGFDESALVNLYEEEVYNLRAASNNHGLVEAFIEVIAHITLSAGLAKELLGLEFDIENMRTYLLKACNDTIETFSKKKA